MFEHTQQGSVHVLASELPLNHEQVAAATHSAMPYVQCGQPRIVLNLQHVPLIDSAGLEWLVTMQQQCTRRGGALRIATPSPLCQQIIEVTGVAQRIEMFPDLTTAVGSFAR